MCMIPGKLDDAPTLGYSGIGWRVCRVYPDGKFSGVFYDGDRWVLGTEYSDPRKDYYSSSLGYRLGYHLFHKRDDARKLKKLLVQHGTAQYRGKLVVVKVRYTNLLAQGYQAWMAFAACSDPSTVPVFTVEKMTLLSLSR